MTEAEWLTYTNPMEILHFLRGKVSDRKLRLFACACCRHIAQWMSAERYRSFIVVAEEHCEGNRTAAELLWAHDDLYGAGSLEDPFLYEDELRALPRADAVPFHLPYPEASVAAEIAAYNAPRVAEEAFQVGTSPRRRASLQPAARALADRERTVLCGLLRDIIGNPFRSLTLSPAWLAWDGGTIPRLAQAIAVERAFDRLPVLGDALEEAGCTNADILTHCRSSGPHALGCWVVDALLGRS